MREILFRGKTEDGYWVEGNLIKNEDASFIAKTEAYSFIGYCMDCNVPFDCDNMHQVIPETVGQYTGLSDRNGNRIFEGDIIKYVVTSDTSWEAIVKWDNDGTRFLGFITGNEPRIMYVGMIDKNNKSVVAVIGNIYDNPELIKDGE